MKTTITSLVTVGGLIVVTSLAETNATNTTTGVITPDYQRIITYLKPMRTVSNAAPCQTVEEARTLIMKNVNIANPQYKRRPNEYGGSFFFSGMDKATQDDGLFSSGIAVKKGTAEIYRWGQ